MARGTKIAGVSDGPGGGEMNGEMEHLDMTEIESVTMLLERIAPPPGRKLIFCSAPTDKNSHILRLYREAVRKVEK